LYVKHNLLLLNTSSFITLHSGPLLSAIKTHSIIFQEKSMFCMKTRFYDP